MIPINRTVASTFSPPVMEARRWLAGVHFPPDRPLMNVSQAAPALPPPDDLRRAMAQASLNDDAAHLYGPVLGNDDLRQALAEDWTAFYRAPVDAANIAITQGCNQAFCAAIATLAGPGDEIILPVPWYFNHKMWLDISGIRAVPLPCDKTMLPRPDLARALIGDRTRAIVLVTPNNPTGAEYPAGLIRAFYDLAREHGLALILDETYRDFHSLASVRGEPPHDLLTLPGWDETLIQLYSFSKSYRLTGHRTGAIIAAPDRMVQVEKWLDTVAICAGQMGQVGAVYGLRHLGDWLAGERDEILRRRLACIHHLDRLPGWTLKSCGAYFAWIEHPFKTSSADLAPLLVREAGVLSLPGTMFMPGDDADGERHFRIAYANIDCDGIAALADRLSQFRA
ncbi:MAG: aminotransferase [Paracoccus sp. (in: a-proteobacteria)]|nr:aminotransferase [Paracoccus sp. (in: a-proteobacteria)]